MTLPRDSFEAEEAVLGSIILDGACLQKIEPFLSPEDFGRQRYATIYRAALHLHAIGQVIDQVTITHVLRDMGKLEEVGGPSALAQLVLSTPTSTHAEHYATVVHNSHVLHDLQKAGARIASIATSTSPEKMNGALEEARTLLETIAAKVLTKGTRRVDITRVRIQNTVPRHYMLCVNGQEIALDTDSLLAPSKFKRAVLERLDFIPLLPKGWEGYVNGFLATAEFSEAPSDASPLEQLHLAIERWFDLRGEQETFGDLLMGGYILRTIDSVDKRLFFPTALLKWLRQEGHLTLTIDRLWLNITHWKGGKQRIRIKDDTRQLWYLPVVRQEQEEQQAELPEWF